MASEGEKKYQDYITSGEYKKELKWIIIFIIVLIVIAIIVAIASYPHYTPEQIACIKAHKWNEYMCGI